MTQFIVRDKLPSFSEVAAQVAKSVIAIAVGVTVDAKEPNIVGTGFALEFSEFFATCWHVAKVHDELIKLPIDELGIRGLKDNKLRVALPAGDRYIWKEIQPYTWLRGWNPDTDTCVLRLVGISIPPLTLYKEPFTWGDTVGLIGFPLGNKLQGQNLRPFVLRTIISGGIDPTPANELKTGHLALGISVAGGFSGGPVFSTVDGRIMGMVASKTLEAGNGLIWPAGISLAISPEDIQSVLKTGITSTTKVIKESLRQTLGKD